MSSWNNPNGYNNGYAPNSNVQFESVVTNIIENVLNNVGRSNSYPNDVIQEVWNRMTANIRPICDNLERMFANGRQIDSNAVGNYLANNEIPNALNSVLQEFRQRASYYNNVNQPFGYNGGNMYNNGFANGCYNRPVNGNFGYNNNNIFNSAPPMFASNTGPVSTGNAASVSGFGRVMREQEYNRSMNAAQNTTPTYNAPINTPNNTVANNQATIEISRRIGEKLFKNFVDKEDRRANKLSIDKLTTDTSELIDNEEFMTTHIGDPNLPTVQVINGDPTLINPEEITVNIEETPTSPEFCDIIAVSSTTDKGNTVDAINFELKVPVVNTKEAIELIKDATPSLVNQDTWFCSICYKELVCKKISGFGIQAKSAFREIQKNLSKINSINDISNTIIPIIRKQPQEVKEYLEALIFDRVNKLFSMSLYEPDDPSNFPIAGCWSDIYTLIDKKAGSEFKFINTMFDKFGEDYPKNVYLCMKSAFIDIFDNEDDVVVDTESDENLGLIAKLPEVTAIVGKYRMSDYGFIPENYKKTLFNKFDHDYIVHKYEQNVFVTNIDVDTILGSKSKYTIVAGYTNLPQFVIGGLTKLNKERGQLVNVPLIQVDNTGENIVGIFTYSRGIDNTVLITKI